MKFFLDNNLSPKLAKSLNALVEPEHQVIHLKDRFPADTSDEEWMLALAKETDWVIISGDIQITKNRAEIEAWKAAGHTTFFLKKGWINLKGWISFKNLPRFSLTSLPKPRTPRAGVCFMLQ